MKKILVVCFIIIFVIVVGDIILQRNIDDTFNYVISELNDINKTTELEKKKSKIENLDSFWDEKGSIMACYIEHVELEKVKSQIVVIKAGIESNDYFFVNEEIERTIDIIERIKEKKALRIDNIL